MYHSPHIVFAPKVLFMVFVLTNSSPHRVKTIGVITTVMLVHLMSKLMCCYVLNTIFRIVGTPMLVIRLVIVEAEIAFYDLAGVRGVQIDIRISQRVVVLASQVCPAYGILAVRVVSRRFIRCPGVSQGKLMSTPLKRKSLQAGAAALRVGLNSSLP